jgi:hypothetical protein
VSRVFIDTNVAMYAGGADHPLREPAQRVVMAEDIISADADFDAMRELRRIDPATFQAGQ